jgi:hypothetical protein
MATVGDRPTLQRPEIIYKCFKVYLGSAAQGLKPIIDEFAAGDASRLSELEFSDMMQWIGDKLESDLEHRPHGEPELREMLASAIRTVGAGYLPLTQ